MSWLSAALHGRLTGSGAIFSGQQNPLDTLTSNVRINSQAVIAGAEADAKKAAGQVVQNVVGVASPGAVVVPQNYLLIAAVVVLILVVKSKSSS